MMRVLFLLVVILALQACSFGKDSYDNSDLIVRQAADPVASLQQKNVLAAVRSGNVAIVERELQKLQISEYSFAGLAETPLGLAVRSDSLEIAKFLIDRSVGPYNLGSEQVSFDENALRRRHQDLLRLLNHARKLREIKTDGVNETTAFVLEFYLKKIKEILEKVVAGNMDAALSAVDRTGLSCLFVQSQVIQSVQLGEIAGSEAIINFLRKVRCEQRLSSSNIQMLYEAELIRQFQALFEAPALLGYLSYQPNLKTTMWNIDNSGIFLAPELLIRIAWSEDNEFLKVGQCSPSGRSDHEPCGDNLDEDDRVQKIITASGIKKSRFEIIKTLEGKVASWSRYYPREVRPILAEADVIYFFTSFYCSGKADFSGVTFPYLAGVKDEDLLGESIPWKAALLTRPDSIPPLTDEYEEEPEKDIPPDLIWSSGRN
ncbi:ankyrin repeat domain-containing protein [Bdellovibrio bacteriovorus]|uniref:ankyrin repeat domain-containing protein n=1 Tax=Bdellovibrio bacteriovorus TaxID=959 RepID=UPI0021CE9DDE|nr:ankyrin repeat domain-containing protein [Bdellovibrio bacteriovorus]UXR65241.1 ankyrin repeat domain-containing protein [Bdellovibrio bacteriovorus]